MWHFSGVVTLSEKDHIIEKVESLSLHQAKLELLNFLLSVLSYLKWDSINEFLLEYAILSF